MEQVQADLPYKAFPTSDGVVAVSYTHLDVYKRQLIISRYPRVGLALESGDDVIDRDDHAGYFEAGSLLYFVLDVYKRQL